MSDRSLRGMRLGSQSMESEENVDEAPSQQVDYQCTTPAGHIFSIKFAAEADIPHRWQCKCGGEAKRMGVPEPAPDGNEKAVRTHWDMLMERRTTEELEQILQDRLTILRERKRLG